MNPKRFWAAVAAGITVIDIYAAFVKHDGTASHVVRETFHTDTVAGKFALCSGWVALTFVVLPHLCKWPKNRLPR